MEINRTTIKSFDCNAKKKLEVQTTRRARTVVRDPALLCKKYTTFFL